jgi:hypothetical protein
MRETGRFATRPWTAGDDEILRSLALNGVDVRLIGSELNRTAMSVRSRARRLNIFLKKPARSPPSTPTERIRTETIVHRIQKFVEADTGRIGYALTAAALAEASNGSVWNLVTSFSVADALLDNPEFASVLRVVLRDGHVIVET